MDLAVELASHRALGDLDLVLELASRLARVVRLDEVMDLAVELASRLALVEGRDEVMEAASRRVLGDRDRVLELASRLALAVDLDEGMELASRLAHRMSAAHCWKPDCGTGDRDLSASRLRWGEWLPVFWNIL